jgi:tetratricopeptide (TPR) repeat protein
MAERRAAKGGRIEYVSVASPPLKDDAMRRVACFALLCLMLASPAVSQDAAPPLGAKFWVDRALAEAGRIEAREERAELLGTIAGAAAEAGDRDGYNRALQLAMAAAKETDELTMGATMWSIAESQARAGDVDAAMMTASGAGDAAYVALAYAGAAKMLAERGRADACARVLEAAAAAVGRITDPFDHGWATYYLVEARLAAGDLDGARALALACGDAISRAESLAAVAVHEARAGQLDQARKTIAQARALIDETRRITPAEELYADFGIAKVAEAEACCGMIEEAVKSLAAVADPSPRAIAVLQLARLHHVQGRADEALAAVTQAVELSNSADDAYERGNNWLDIAHARVMLGMTDDLAKWIDSLPEPTERAFANLGAANGVLELQRGK